MKSRIYWGVATLIVLLIGVSVFLLTQTTDTKVINVYNDVAPSKDNPPPDEPGYKWVWHHNHWDKVKEDTVSEQGNAILLNTEEYGITRQGKRYKKDSAWADREEAHTIPTGPPLTIDWHTWANLNTRNFQLDWRDPRTWEAYRNFWGFDRPHVNPDGSVPWRARLDNWGTPLQLVRNVSLVVRWSKRTGFRPTPEQFAEHQSLVERYEIAQSLGDAETAASLRGRIVALEASAQGTLPEPTSYMSIGYGDPLPENLSASERRRINKEEEATGIRNLYKRLGIEHLYEFYEKP